MGLSLGNEISTFLLLVDLLEETFYLFLVLKHLVHVDGLILLSVNCVDLGVYTEQVES